VKRGICTLLLAATSICGCTYVIAPLEDVKPFEADSANGMDASMSTLDGGGGDVVPDPAPDPELDAGNDGGMMFPSDAADLPPNSGDGAVPSDAADLPPFLVDGALPGSDGGFMFPYDTGLPPFPGDSGPPGPLQCSTFSLALQGAASSVSIEPQSVNLVDVNNDNRLDAVVLRRSAGSMGVFPGNGDGTLQGRIDRSSGPNTRHVAFGFLDGDANLDAVVYATNLSALLGNGDASFQAPSLLETNADLGSLTLADLDNDMKTDIISIDFVDSDVGVLIGNGDGTVQTRTSYGTAPSPSRVLTAQLNPGGNLDVVVLSSSLVSVHLGNGDGTLQPKVDNTVDPGSNEMVIADVNADGAQDILVSNGADGLSVLLGNGDGTFGASQSYTTSASTRVVGIAVADMDLDGNLDVIAASPADDAVLILPGVGDGTFGTSVPFSTGLPEAPIFVSVGDLNGDLRPDVAFIVAGNGTNEQLRILLNNCTP